MPKLSADRLDGTLASECRTLFVDASCQCYSQEGRSFRLEMRSLPRGDVVWCPVDALVPFRLSLSRPSSSLALLQNRFPPSRPIIFRHVTHVLLSALRTRARTRSILCSRGDAALLIQVHSSKLALIGEGAPPPPAPSLPPSHCEPRYYCCLGPPVGTNRPHAERTNGQHLITTSPFSRTKWRGRRE